MHVEADIEHCEWVHVRGVKCVDFAAAFFSRPVSADDLIVKVDYNFRDLKWTRDH